MLIHLPPDVTRDELAWVLARDPWAPNVIEGLLTQALLVDDPRGITRWWNRLASMPRIGSVRSVIKLAIGEAIGRNEMEFGNGQLATAVALWDRVGMGSVPAERGINDGKE